VDTKNRTELLRKIKDEVIALKESPLYKERIKNNVFPVIGEGDHYAKIMFVGEAPGKNKAKTGRPFCGASGKILDELLALAEIDRKSVYVTNIVKDRPPFNRDPLPEEIQAYAPFLDRQIDIIRPKVIATLGRFSMDYIMRKFSLDNEITGISRVHGKVFSAKGGPASGGDSPITGYGSIKIIPLYHPAVAVYNNNMKQDLINDFKILEQFK
jgi:DNA polymerase